MPRLCRLRRVLRTLGGRSCAQTKVLDAFNISFHIKLPAAFQASLFFLCILSADDSVHNRHRRYCQCAHTNCLVRAYPSTCTEPSVEPKTEHTTFTAPPHPRISPKLNTQSRVMHFASDLLRECRLIHRLATIAFTCMYIYIYIYI